MAFYGYDPARYVQRDRYGIGAASQIAAQTVAGMPGRIREKEKYETQKVDRDKAIEAAQKDWVQMDNAWKAIKNQYVKHAEPLVQNGIMSQEELNSNMKRLRMPTRADKKDAGKYIDDIGKTFGELIGDVNAKTRQMKLTGAVSKSITPPQPQPQGAQQPEEAIPSRYQTDVWEEAGEVAPPQPQEQMIPPRGASTQSDIAGAPGVQQLAPTTKELGQVPQYATTPTREQLQKQKIAQEKNEIQKLKLSISQEKESNINWYREMTIRIKGQLANLSEDKDELTRMKARKDLGKWDTALISLLEESKDTLKELESPVDEFGEQIPKDYAAIAQQKKVLEEYEALRKQIPGLELQTIRKGTTFNTQTGQTSPAQPQRRGAGL